MQLDMSALHYASKEGHDSIVDILIAAEANTEIKNSVSDKSLLKLSQFRKFLQKNLIYFLHTLLLTLINKIKLLSL